MTTRLFNAAAALTIAALAPTVALADAPLGPVWRTWNSRVHEDKMEDYLRYLTEVYSYKLAAWKEAGLLTDYRIVIAEPLSKDDWNVSLMYQYKNMAALDVPEKIWDDVGKKAMDKVKDPEAKAMESEYHEWREFVGWGRMTRELKLQ
jgi:hypothetical protein